jgi:hypothetical protein
VCLYVTCLRGCVKDLEIRAQRVRSVVVSLSGVREVEGHRVSVPSVAQPTRGANAVPAHHVETLWWVSSHFARIGSVFAMLLQRDRVCQQKDRLVIP